MQIGFVTSSSYTYHSIQQSFEHWAFSHNPKHWLQGDQAYILMNSPFFVFNIFNINKIQAALFVQLVLKVIGLRV